MPEFDISIRKHLENETVDHWLLITAKPAHLYETENFRNSPFGHSLLHIISQFMQSFYWTSIIVLTVFLNTTLYITYYWMSSGNIFGIVIVMHVCCLLYWIDFISKIILTVRSKKLHVSTILSLIIDAITLIPLSSIYLIVVGDFWKSDNQLLWQLRAITLLRFYRIPQFFAKLMTVRSSDFELLIASSSCYVIIFVLIISNIFLRNQEGYSTPQIKDWNATSYNKIVISLYYTAQMMLNVGYGDIVPLWYSELVMCAFAMSVGAVLSNGLIASTLGVVFTRSAQKREHYRYEYEAIKNTLKTREIDANVIRDILDNMIKLWKHKRGFTGSLPIHLLPLSMQKEVYFDINFGLLSHSLIFSKQPRSFLRSVTMFMQNITYLPGDIVVDPGISDLMICVASGIIEILSEQNDESAIFSLTNGSTIGEAALFFPIVNRCIIRASTYVELQVLKKVDFTRLALTYPEIFRSMRNEIFARIYSAQQPKEPPSTSKSLATSKGKMRRETKRFLRTLREAGREESKKKLFISDIKDMYVLSENIPRVKTLPITLISERPWIIRPETSLTKFWDNFLFVVIVFASIYFPLSTAYSRELKPWSYVLIFVTRAVYLVDVYLELTTAVERKDHYTFTTSIKKILAHRLKTPGFYLDVLSTYYLSVYANLIWPHHAEYGHWLLSLNLLLKVWRVKKYMTALENNMNNNLLFLVTFKYLLWIIFIITWGSMVYYLEARPLDTYLEDRWFGKMQVQEAMDPEAIPRSKMNPGIVTTYYASVTIFTLGCGDIVPACIADCCINIVSILLGFIFLVTFAGEVASVTRHLARLKTNYQEELFGVDRFIVEHDISEDCRISLYNYLRLQWEYDRGYSLKKITMAESSSRLPVLQRRIITNEIVKAFLTVPLFQRVDPGFLKFLAKSCQIHVLPPNEVITEKDSYYRQMYILESGYCQISSNKTKGPKVIGSPNPFGYVEMIRGERQRLRVVTVTHVRVISLHYSSYFLAITKFPGVRMGIEEKLGERYTENSEDYLLGFDPLNESVESLVTIGIQKQILSKPIVNVFKYHKTISEGYCEPFDNWGRFRIFRFFFLPISISPNTLFIKIWMILRMINASIVGFIAPVQFSILDDSHWFKDLIIALQILCVIDMYLMFHVAYYDNKGILIFHPAMTSTHYLKGNFIVDFILVFPYRWFLHLILSNQSGMDKIKRFGGFIMALQLFRIFQCCNFYEKDILRKTNIIKILKLIFLVSVVVNFVSGVIILILCAQVESEKKLLGLKGSTRLALELEDDLKTFCLCDDRNKSLSNAQLYKMYLATAYWVMQTVTVCGFGDIVANTETVMMWVIILTILGIYFLTLMFANVTSSMVNTTVAITQYRKQMLLMIRFMKKKKVKEILQKRFRLHYEYNWHRTTGANPQVVLSFLNEGLKQRIVNSMYEATISKNPVFDGFEKQVQTAFGSNFTELYFLKGEIIIKHMDVENDIYLIYRGEVHVIAPEGTLLAAMGSGGLFGNISNKSFYLSSKSIIAGENVDLLKINSKTFFSNLQNFLNTESLINTLYNSSADYVSPREEGSRKTMFEPATINKYRLPASTLLKEEFPQEFANGASNNFRAYKDVLVHIPEKPYSTYIIMPDSTLETTIGIIVTAMAVLSYFLTLYMFAFHAVSLRVIISTYILDAFLLFEIYFHFHTTYSDKYGDCVVDMKKIVKRYLKSKKLYVYIISNVPLEIFMFFSPRNEWMTYFTILRLNRLVRLYYIYDFFVKAQKRLMCNKINLQLGWVVTVTCMIIHTLGCMWYAVACPVNNCFDPSWITDMDLLNREKWEYYIYSVIQIILIASSTGLQIIPVYTVPEIMLVNFFMLTCRYCIVLTTSFVLAAVNASTLYKYEFYERSSLLIETFKRLNISEYQLTKMKEYLKSLWVLEAGTQMPRFISRAPYTMKCEIMSDMFGSHLYQSYIFSKTQPAFLNQLSAHLKRYVYFHGNYIVQQGDVDFTMYFINEGEVSVLTIHPEHMETIHFKLTKNDHFGAKQGLIIGKPHNFTYRADTNVEMLLLSFRDWQHLLKYFPSDAEIIYKNLERLP